MNEKDDILCRKEKPNRLLEYKTRSNVLDQEARRLELLQAQKRRREKSFNEARKAALFTSLENEENELNSEAMEWTEAKSKRQNLKDMFMLSEWMVKIPEDFEENWLFVMCPVGKRCLVQCTKGCTIAFGKQGQTLAKFQSALPNGSRKDITGSRYSNSEVTVLDCIWSPQTKSYFILDILSWKGQLYIDTETSFRAFWIKSKLEESPRLSERCDKNPFPFIHLNHYMCDVQTIYAVISNYPYFPLDEPKVDGILFYHKEAFYTSGSTPLVVWIKPFMLPEILNISIPEMYLRTKPDSYVNMEHYIASFEEKQKKKRPRGRRRQMEIDEQTNSEIFETVEELNEHDEQNFDEGWI